MEQDSCAQSDTLRGRWRGQAASDTPRSSPRAGALIRARGHLVNFKQAGGEHAYYDPSAGSASVDVPETVVVGFSHDTTN